MLQAFVIVLLRQANFIADRLLFKYATHLPFIYRILLIALMVLPAIARAQVSPVSPVSSLRHKIFRADKDTVQLDSLAIAPGTLHIPGVADSNFIIIPHQSRLIWKHRPASDSFRVQ